MEVVETELILSMFKKYLLVAVIGLSCIGAAGQEYRWKHVGMDGSRTGCVSPSKDNVAEAVGSFRGCRYVAPNGRKYRKGSAVGRTARLVIDAQPSMARVKDVIGYSTRFMTKDYPESALSDWFVDIIMAKTEELADRKVHIGVANFGGIRMDMPQGEIILDDMLSMFPFRNHLVYVEHRGSQIRRILEEMAAGYFQVLGGVRVVAQDGKLVSIEVGGEPLEDDKIYGMATISFLLGGGDGLSLEEGALSVTQFESVQIIDAVLEHVAAETAAGRPIEYEADGRVMILDSKEKTL